MKETIWIKVMAKEIERLKWELEFLENEYRNYMKEEQQINQSKKHFKYDMEALKEKHKDKITKGIKARF